MKLISLRILKLLRASGEGLKIVEIGF
jgi:hypothetical protein